MIDVLRRMGADRGATPRDASAAPSSDGEPVADLVVRSSRLRAIDLGPRDVAAAIDEIPVLCLAATQAAGTTRSAARASCRHKESDRIAGVADGLRSLGAWVEVEGDDIAIHGRRDCRRPTTASTTTGSR